MKTITIIIAGLLMTTIATNSFGQEKVKVVKKEIKKEVKMKDYNGKKVLTITTSEDGKVTEETFEGIEAEVKMKELQSENTIKIQEETKEIIVEIVDGQKKLTIITKKDNQVKEEVYVGIKAEQKIKEMGINETNLIEVEK